VQKLEHIVKTDTMSNVLKQLIYSCVPIVKCTYNCKGMKFAGAKSSGKESSRQLLFPGMKVAVECRNTKQNNIPLESVWNTKLS